MLSTRLKHEEICLLVISSQLQTKTPLVWYFSKHGKRESYFTITTLKYSVSPLLKMVHEFLCVPPMSEIQHVCHDIVVLVRACFNADIMCSP